MNSTLTETIRIQLYIKSVFESILNLVYFANLTLIPLGIFFNLVTFAVFQRKPFSLNNIGLFYSKIAIVDILALVSSFLFMFGASIGNDFTLFSDFTCKFLNYLNRMSFQMSAWLNVFATYERWLRIKYAGKKTFYFLQSRMRLFLINFALIFISTVICIPNLLLQVNVRISNGTINGTLIKQSRCTSIYSIIFARDLIAIIFRIYIPFFNANSKYIIY